jgi:hypothetical protein
MNCSHTEPFIVTAWIKENRFSVNDYLPLGHHDKTENFPVCPGIKRLKGAAHLSFLRGVN